MAVDTHLPLPQIGNYRDIPRFCQRNRETCWRSARADNWCLQSAGFVYHFAADSSATQEDVVLSAYAF